MWQNCVAAKAEVRQNCPQAAGEGLRAGMYLADGVVAKHELCREQPRQPDDQPRLHRHSTSQMQCRVASAVLDCSSKRCTHHDQWRQLVGSFQDLLLMRWPTACHQH